MTRGLIETVELDLRNIRSELLKAKADLLSGAGFSRAHTCSNIGMTAGMARSWHALFEMTTSSILFGGAVYTTEQPTYLPRSAELIGVATDLMQLNRNFCLFFPDQSEEEFVKQLNIIQNNLEDLLNTITLFVKS